MKLTQKFVPSMSLVAKIVSTLIIMLAAISWGAILQPLFPQPKGLVPFFVLSGIETMACIYLAIISFLVLLFLVWRIAHLLKK